MNKTRFEKGITLIALVITIIVLLILAVVTIGSIKNNNIITYAQNAAKDYNEEKEKENSTLDDYEKLIDEYSKKDEEDEPKETKEKIEYYIDVDDDGEIIQKIEYDDFYTTVTANTYIHKYSSNRYEYNGGVDAATLGEPIQSSIQISLDPDSNTNISEITVNAGAIPLSYQGNIIAYKVGDVFYGMNFSDGTYMIFNKVTDQNKIQEIEQGIASIQ